jgi:hypothetical protein
LHVLCLIAGQMAGVAPWLWVARLLPAQRPDPRRRERNAEIADNLVKTVHAKR